MKAFTAAPWPFRRSLRMCSLLCALAIAAQQARAANQTHEAKETGPVKPPVPLWEFGLGIGTVAFPDYRGANVYNVYPVPVPYVVYHGDFIKADRKGLRGLFLDSNIVEVNLSFGATTPVRSRHRGAREGMPGLHTTVEAGPSVDFHLWKSSSESVALDLRIPFRYAVTVEASPQSLGWFLAPNLNLDFHAPEALHHWDVGVLAGPLFAQRRYDAYFYSVAPGYARPGREPYEAAGGYAGSQVTTAISKRFRKYWVGAFARYDNLTGASFEDSPLVRTRHAFSAGIGIAWIIGQSSRLVDDE